MTPESRGSRDRQKKSGKVGKVGREGSGEGREEIQANSEGCGHSIPRSRDSSCRCSFHPVYFIIDKRGICEAVFGESGCKFAFSCAL